MGILSPKAAATTQSILNDLAAATTTARGKLVALRDDRKRKAQAIAAQAERLVSRAHALDLEAEEADSAVLQLTSLDEAPLEQVGNVVTLKTGTEG